MSRRVWEIVKAKAEKNGMAKTKRRREMRKEQRTKKRRRKNQKRKR